MPTIHQNIMEIMSIMGGQRALSKMESLKEGLMELHNEPGSIVADHEKGCWDGALAAWKRVGMPKNQRIYGMMVVEQYNLGFVQEIIGGAQDAGRERFSEEDLKELEECVWEIERLEEGKVGIVQNRAAEAAALI